ncbi:MAG: VOC family protein [Deltaproteobacteria bacterium]|nr:VOC family protein [Deltaproteobacteria bacterium]
MIKAANTILYCSKWEDTVRFYRDQLKLPVNFSTDWFVEFSLNAMSRLSVADEKRASIKTSRGKGITLSWEVDRIDSAWTDTEKNGLAPTPIRKHPWGARFFFLFDPEGHRIEFWQSFADLT